MELVVWALDNNKKLARWFKHYLEVIYSHFLINYLIDALHKN